MANLLAPTLAKPISTLSRMWVHVSLVLLAGQLLGCFAMEAQPSNNAADIRADVAKHPEVIYSADLATKLKGIKEKPSLKVEKVSTNDSKSQLKGELTLESFVDFKQAVNAKLVLHNPAPHAISLRYHSGMTADLVLTTEQGQRLWAWSDDMMFTQALRDTQLASGESLVVAFAIPPKALAGIPMEGAYLEAQFSGIELQSGLPAMAPIVLLLKLE